MFLYLRHGDCVGFAGAV